MQDNITLFGESSGAIHIHAHLTLNTQIKQAILSSGSLYLSPPRDGSALIARFNQALADAGTGDLRTASVDALVELVKLLNVPSFWLQPEPDLEGWQNRTGSAQRLMLGDCEYEVHPSLSLTALIRMSLTRCSRSYGATALRPWIPVRSRKRSTAPEILV